MEVVTDSDKDFLSMLGTFGVIILTSFLIIIATNSLRQNESEMSAHTVEVVGDSSTSAPCTIDGTNC
jgi:hypothetical protein